MCDFSMDTVIVLSTHLHIQRENSQAASSDVSSFLTPRTNLRGFKSLLVSFPISISRTDKDNYSISMSRNYAPTEWLRQNSENHGLKRRFVSTE